MSLLLDHWSQGMGHSLSLLWRHRFVLQRFWGFNIRKLTVGSLDFLRLWVRCCSCSTASLGTFGICYENNVYKTQILLGVSRFNQTHYWIWHNRSDWRWCDWPWPGWQPFPQPWPVVWRCERGTWWGSPGRATAAWCSRPEAAPLERWSGMTGGLGRWICGEDQHWLLIFIKNSLLPNSWSIME